MTTPLKGLEFIKTDKGIINDKSYYAQSPLPEEVL